MDLLGQQSIQADGAQKPLSRKARKASGSSARGACLGLSACTHSPIQSLDGFDGFATAYYIG